jgi:hypothetical protein
MQVLGSAFGEGAAGFTHALTLSSGSPSHAPEALSASLEEALALLAVPLDSIRALAGRLVKASEEETAAAITSKVVYPPRHAMPDLEQD